VGTGDKQEMAPGAPEGRQEMRVPTSSEIAALDRTATDTHGIPVAALMEQAGRRVAQAALLMLGRRRGRIAVLAGKGNNGGDGLVAARILHGQGIAVTAVLAAPVAEYSGEAGRSLAEAQAAGVDVSEGPEVPLASFDMIIDGLFGTGFKGPARGAPKALIEAANASLVPILAVDVPSGLDADTGRPDGPAIRAGATVTMGLPKVGLLLYPGAELAGTVYVADIGYPADLADDPSVRTHLVMPEMVRARLPARPPDSHKGSYGRTVIIAGSVGFTGAAALAALGALRSGAGLVTLCVPRAVYPIIAGLVAEAMPRPVDDEGGHLSGAAWEAVHGAADGAGADAIAIGPGLGTSAGVRTVVQRLLLEAWPLVIDADALNVLAGQADPFGRPSGPRIITPHPGELARLVGSTPADIQFDRLSAARAAAARFRCVVVLKGARTIVAEPGGEAFIVPTGNPGMAAGGMGDVLTGMIASFLGQGIPATDAAWVAAYLHGLAADLIAAERGVVGILATEVAHRVPAAVARVRRGEQPDPVILLRG
jgi:NAD(P)H-hydrate epimerase